jgi:hypothetical protein
MPLRVIDAVPLVVGSALMTRRWRLALYAALAGATIHLMAKASWRLRLSWSGVQRAFGTRS